MNVCLWHIPFGHSLYTQYKSHVSFALFAVCVNVKVIVPGEDLDLCSELLQESLAAMQSLPPATLFDHSAVSPVWMEVVDRSAKFLKQVVLGWVMILSFSIVHYNLTRPALGRLDSL